MIGQRISFENSRVRILYFILVFVAFAGGQIYLLCRYFATGMYSVPGGAFLFAALALSLQMTRTKWFRK
jgi:hypothetical protein